MNFDITVIKRFRQLLLSGTPVILGSSLASVLFGALIGLATVFLRRANGVFNLIVAACTDLFHKTSIHVQMFFIYFGILNLVPGFNTNNRVAGILVFSPNSGAYVSEIIRAGIDGIDKGQIGAAKVLGISDKDIGKDIIIPQVFCNVLPAVISEFITLTKGASTVSVIGLYGMIYWFYVVRDQTYADFEPLLIVFLIYYIMNKVLSLIGKAIERRLKYDQSRAFM